MSRKTMTLLLALIALLPLAAPAQAGDPITDGLAWLKTQQQPDGGFTNGFSEGSDLGTTCDVILAIAANGEDASTWASDDGNSPLDYLYAQVAAGVADTMGLRAKAVMATLATGQNPAAFAGHDLIAELDAAYDEGAGSYGETIFDHALVMLALLNAGQQIPDGAAQHLLDSRGDDGAWTLFGDVDGASDTNTSAMAVQALLATGHQEEAGDAFSYFHGVQNDDGGFPYQNPSDYGTDTDANSTAIVLQALLAAEEPLDDWSPGGSSPLDALTALHDSDSGGFLWQAAVPGPNVLATAQAIPALAGYTFVDLPSVEAAAPPGSATAAADATLPESGGVALLPMGLIGLGVAALGAGFGLRRRKHGKGAV
jgi:hypothetical protein